MTKKGKNFLIAAGIIAALLMSGGALVRQISTEKTKEVHSYSYTIGAVDEEGKIDKQDKSSMTSDKFSVKDLVSIEIDEDAKVLVFIYWYNEDGDFLQVDEVTGELPETPDGAKTFCVGIEPTDDDDGEISAFEKGGYAKLVTVTLKK